jgi:hypothetical protein
MFCDWLVDTVLAFWAGDLGNPIALVVGPKAAGNPIALVVGPKAAREIGALLATHTHQISLCALRGSARAAGFVSWCCNFFCLPRGNSATGAGPSWVGGTRAMPSGDIWGKTAPPSWPLVHSIGLS